MPSGIMLIVGLGNPGAEYERTRHNAGAWLVESLARHADINLRPETKFHALHGAAKLFGHECHLMIPTTYMNLSGQAIQAIANYYKILPENILVAHDEIDLPVGEVRIKLDGGHGGHNGLRDTIKHLNTNKFYRLRIGVGHPGNSRLVENYVLKPPSKSEQSLIEKAIEDAESVLPLLLKGEFQRAMMALHTKE